MGLTPLPVEARECLAKSVMTGGVRRYYVKCGNGPSGAYGPCNPNGIDFRPQDLGGVDALNGRPWFDWREVSIAGYEMYLGFLETKNPGLLNNFVRIEGV
jgi:hypothetical protein